MIKRNGNRKLGYIPHKFRDTKTITYKRANVFSNGAKNLVRSEHDNTQIVRWTVREKAMGNKNPLRDANRLAAQHRGVSEEWVKMRTPKVIEFPISTKFLPI